MTKNTKEQEAAQLATAASNELVPGKATHWSLESIFSAQVDVPFHNEYIEIGVSTEVPLNDAKQRVVRRGNRYYPTTIDVECSHSDFTLFPDTARELAKALLAAADACEAADMVDADVCGHWAPCECDEAVRARRESSVKGLSS